MGLLKISHVLQLGLKFWKFDFKVVRHFLDYGFRRLKNL